MSKILVIDDEKSIRNVLKDVLEYEKYQVDTAENGKKGLEKIKNEPPDLVLCDIKMPEMDGFEASKQIRKLNKHIPIIAQSAYAMPVEIEKGYLLGINDYITKPVNPKKLLSVLNKYLEHNQKNKDIKR